MRMVHFTDAPIKYILSILTFNHYIHIDKQTDTALLDDNHNIATFFSDI